MNEQEKCRWCGAPRVGTMNRIGSIFKCGSYYYPEQYTDMPVQTETCLRAELAAERKRGDEERERAKRLKEALYETDCLHNTILYLEAHWITPIKGKELSQLWCYATTGDAEMANTLESKAEATQEGDD
jgi:hypothetical protein